MIRHGGRYQKRDGSWAGEGLPHHYQQFQRIIWPEKVWHKWNRLLLEQFCTHRMIGVTGPASSGKTAEAAWFVLTSYYAWPDCTTVLVSSTEREMLEMRVWGEMKKAHKLAKERCEWIPGTLIESRQRIVTDNKDEDSEGRDFRNGCVGLACKRGGSYVGMGSIIGVKNKHVLHVADELQFMPSAFVDAISNLNKNRGFKCIGIGNPKDITDCLGKFCEPSVEQGGWEGGIDQTGGTKTWATKWPDGVAVQLVGSDSPNMSVPPDAPEPYPFLIGRKEIEADIAFYGRDSLQFSMMDEGRFPRGIGLRRVITRQMCQKFGAMEEPIWRDDKRTHIGGLDAAYGSIGGDRCVFIHLQIGRDVDAKQILALTEVIVVPIDSKSSELPEDQIANFVMNQCATRRIIPENFFFDSTGRGSLMGAFARLWSPHVQPIEFGGRPSERPISQEQQTTCREYYFNFVSELWFTVRLIIMGGQFRGLTEEVMNEGCMREWKLVGKNKTQVETKAEMKLKMARSPDLFDALVAAVEGARRRGFAVTRLSGDNIRRNSGVWKQGMLKRMEKMRKRQQLTYT